MTGYLGNLDDLRPFLVAAAFELGVVATAENCADPRTLLANRRYAQFIAALQSEELLREQAGSWHWQGPVAPLPVAGGGWGELAKVIRTDTPLAADRADCAGSSHIGAFQQFLANVGAAAASEVAECAATLPLVAGDIVDVGAGLGTYGRAAASRLNRRCVLVDRPEVLQLMTDFSESVVPLATDLTATGADWGSGYALCILANVAHLYALPQVNDILRKAMASLRPGGWLLLKDFNISADGLSPRLGVLFSLNMALYTQAGEVHRPMELADILTKLGLVEVEVRPLLAEPGSFLLASRTGSGI